MIRCSARLWPQSLVLFLILICGCDKPAPSPENSADSEDGMVMDEMGDSLPEGGRRDPRTPKGVRPVTGEPITMEIIDENANPAVARGLLTQDEINSGWISLFDGETLMGWQSNQPEVKWKVENGAITADVGPAGLLLTTVPFSNYELICEFRLEAGGNSGVFLRSTFDPKDLQHDCIELNLADDHPEGYTTGSLVARAKTKEDANRRGEWQKIRVTVNRTSVIVELNDKEVVEYKDSDPAPRTAGFIGLQQRFGKVEFRKVNIKPYPLKSIFNGENLTGWTIVPGSQAKFNVDDNCLRVQGGPGFLETEDQYRNFIFQTEVRTGVPDVNSGFFYRAEPGTEKAPSNGYEVQINNGFKANDRNQPSNSGSGAIFRRVDARRVVANDQEWYTMTLVANGPRSAVWVNGYQVVDWVDEREPHSNPRKGLRLEQGHISLQGHDPTTDCEFRNLRMATLPDEVDAAIVSPPAADKKTSAPASSGAEVPPASKEASAPAAKAEMPDKTAPPAKAGN